jgi:dTDP-4-dehydrorhamnose reductase
LASKDTNSYLVHISTDHLFGDDNIFHEENDKVLLLNNYAETKYQGEEYIKFNCTQFLILRTNFFCQGYSKDSFADWIVKSIKSKEYIDLFDDVYFNPIHSFKIFESIDLLYKQDISGLFNISSNERFSKFDFGLALAQKLNLDTQYIHRGSISESPALKTQRPKSMLLSNQKLTSNIEIDLSISSSINTYTKEISQEAS